MPTTRIPDKEEQEFLKALGFKESETHGAGVWINDSGGRVIHFCKDRLDDPWFGEVVNSRCRECHSIFYESVDNLLRTIGTGNIPERSNDELVLTGNFAGEYRIEKESDFLKRIKE